MRKVLCVFCITFSLFSCKFEENVSTELNTSTKRIWTTIVYMAADNNLESAAIQDLNELESVSLSGSRMSVLVLLDRAEGEDGTNGDWTDTRLFEVKKDPKGKNGTIISKRLSCPELDLYTDRETELNMADPYTLSGLINFAKKNYEAEHYALIMWGHGNGWRGMNPVLGNELDSGMIQSFDRAFATDDKTKGYMTISEFKSAVEKNCVDLIFFDTCFGAVLENVYELKDLDITVIGSPGLTPVTGLDYEKFLNLYKQSDKSILGFSKCISESASVVTTRISTADIKEIGDAANDFFIELANSIIDSESRDEVYKQLYTKTKSYTASSYPTEMFLDVYAIADFYASSKTQMIKTKAEKVKILFEEKCYSSNEIPALGIYFMTLEAKNYPYRLYPDEYCQSDNGGGLLQNKASFVQKMDGWVPTGKDSSLLDKLFFTTF